MNNKNIRILRMTEIHTTLNPRGCFNLMGNNFLFLATDKRYIVLVATVSVATTLRSEQTRTIS